MKRTTYMQELMTSTYSQAAVNAVMNGTIKGAWEEAIADRIRLDVLIRRKPEAIALCDQTGIELNNPQCFVKAAEIVMKSEIDEGAYDLDSIKNWKKNDPYPNP